MRKFRIESDQFSPKIVEADEFRLNSDLVFYKRLSAYPYKLEEIAAVPRGCFNFVVTVTS